MAVYVDELRVWRAGVRPTCHLTADTARELAAFARELGVPAQLWHHGAKIPHFDLDASWRQTVLTAGARFMPARDQARMRRCRRRPAG